MSEQKSLIAKLHVYSLWGQIFTIQYDEVLQEIAI